MILRTLARLPVIYHTVAFLTAKRVKVNQSSMYPALAPEEYLLFDRLAYRWRGPHRREIVLAIHPEQPTLKIVKRVVAVPGDRVRLSAGSLWVNDSLYAADPAFDEGLDRAWHLADDQYFLIGDALPFSTDSRHYGPVSGQQILGRAWFVYWPPQRMRVVSKSTGLGKPPARSCDAS